RPLVSPAGRSDASQSRGPVRSRVQEYGSGGARETSRPAASRTPVPGSAASLDRTSSPIRPHSITRSGGPTFTAPQTAPAATDVVWAGSAAVLIVTPSPASARLIAVLRPTAPAP